MGTILGYKPHTNQRKVHTSINTDSAKYYALCIGRQWGKSLLGENQSLYWMINDPGSSVGWVSPIYKQSKKVYKELKAATVASGLFAYNDTDLIISGKGSTMQFFSAENADGIRGNTFDYLICDEFDFIKLGIWEEVLQPTVLVKGKKVLFISTPKGRKMMFKLKQLAQTDDRYRYFHFSSYDNPMIDSREIDSIRQNVPEHIFRQEYLAEFIDNAAGIFKNVRECIGIGESGKNYGGVDVGRADDFTVLTIENDKGEEIFSERWRHDDWSKIVDKVAKAIKEHKAHTYVEVNNQGDVFFELLRGKCGNLVQPFVTTTKTKPQMIEDLAVDFEQKDVTILGHEWQIDELESFTYIYDPKRRTVKYSAPEGIHDDYVISKAICGQARKHLSKKGVYIVMK